MQTTLSGNQVTLRPATVADTAALVAIRATPEVYQRWGGDDLDTSVVVEPIVIPSRLRLWTDDYNNLFQILRPVRFLKRDAS